MCAFVGYCGLMLGELHLRTEEASLEDKLHWFTLFTVHTAATVSPLEMGRRPSTQKYNRTRPSHPGLCYRCVSAMVVFAD